MEYLTLDDDLSVEDRADRRHQARLQFIRDSMAQAQSTTEDVLYNLSDIDNKFDALDHLMKKMKETTAPLHQSRSHIEWTQKESQRLLRKFTIVDQVLGTLDDDKGVTSTWVSNIREMLESRDFFEKQEEILFDAQTPMQKIKDNEDKIKENVSKKMRGLLQKIKVKPIVRLKTIGLENSADSFGVESLVLFEHLYCKAIALRSHGTYNDKVDAMFDAIIERLMFDKNEFTNLKHLVELMRTCKVFNKTGFAKDRAQSLHNQFALIEQLCLKDQDLDRHIEELRYENGTHVYINYLNLAVKSFQQERKLVLLLGNKHFQTIYPMIIGAEFTKFIEKTKYVILESPKISRNCHYICIDMIRELREKEETIRTFLVLPFHNDSVFDKVISVATTVINPFALGQNDDTRLIDNWSRFFESAICTVIKRLLKIEKKMAALHLRDPPENASLSAVPPNGMMLLRELSFGQSDMLLWMIERYNEVLLREAERVGDELEEMVWGDVVDKIVMGMVVNVERAAKRYYSGIMTRSFFLMNNYKYIWDSLVQFRETLTQACPELLEQCEHAIEEMVLFVRLKAIEYATVYKWETFGDVLDAVWEDPDTEPPPYTGYSCTTMTDEDRRRVGIELDVAERFIKFTNGFEELIDPDSDYRLVGDKERVLYISDAHLRGAFNKVVVQEVIGGYVALFNKYTQEDPMHWDALIEFDKMPRALKAKIDAGCEHGIQWSADMVNKKLRELYSEESAVLDEVQQEEIRNATANRDRGTGTMRLLDVATEVARKTTTHLVDEINAGIDRTTKNTKQLVRDSKKSLYRSMADAADGAFGEDSDDDDEDSLHGTGALGFEPNESPNSRRSESAIFGKAATSMKV